MGELKLDMGIGEIILNIAWEKLDKKNKKD
jgi:hypothetical protein